MTNTFFGIYFDGNSVQPLAAEVHLTPSALQIIYRTQNGTLPVTVYWQANHIGKETFADLGKTILRYGNHPAQSLEISDPAFLPLLKQYYAAAPVLNHNDPLVVSKSPRWIWPVALFILALVPLTYFWLIPLVADFTARKVPVAYERALGKKLQAGFLASATVKPKQTRAIRGFARQLQLKAHYPIQITVIKEKEPNAFAIPGGFMVVHDGILAKMKGPGELAALLAHEYGHIKLRHSTRALFRNLSGYLFISILFGDISGITAIVLENANSLRSLQYSRELEKEADVLGLELLLQNKQDPYGMVRLFDSLRQGKEVENTEFFSTHPLLTSRISNIKELLRETKPTAVPNDSLIYYWQQLKTIQE